MIKWNVCGIIVMLLVFELVSGHKSWAAGGDSTHAGDVVSSEVAQMSESGALISVDIETMQGFGKVGQEKVSQAVELLTEVLNSQEFKNGVIHYKYQGKEQFANNTLNGKTVGNQVVYQTILAGRENYASTDDHTVDLNLILYTPPWYKPSNVVGYTYPNSKSIWMNSKFFNQFSAAQVAGNMAHEWLHKLGFGHDYNSTSRRPYSVPYAVGYLVVDLAKSVLNGVRLNPAL